ncbi:MAG: hypothetical protein HY647_06215 [Acidobacteria bacterium]|nr:hypothetical protein [Acidobacteriota bacterium]
MIFDKLWWAERRARKEARKIREKYKPLLEAARKEGNDKYERILNDFHFEQDLNDEPEQIRTTNLIKQAKKFGIPIPSMPTSYDLADWDDNETWELNQTNYPVLTDKAEQALAREIKREKDEQDQRWMRWVTLITGLIGTLMGLISLLHSLELIG